MPTELPGSTGSIICLFTICCMKQYGRQRLYLMNSDLLIHTLSYTPTSTCDVRDYHWTITPNLFPTTDHSLPAKTSFLKTNTTMAAATSVILSPKIDSSQKQVQLVAFAYYLVRVILYYCILYTRYYVVQLCTSENSLRQTCSKEVRILPTLFEKHLQHLLAPAAFFRVMVSALPR